MSVRSITSDNEYCRDPLNNQTGRYTALRRPVAKIFEEAMATRVGSNLVEGVRHIEVYLRIKPYSSFLYERGLSAPVGVHGCFFAPFWLYGPGSVSVVLLCSVDCVES